MRTIYGADLLQKLVDHALPQNTVKYQQEMPMRIRTYRIAWGFSLVVAVTLGCNILSGLTEDVREVRGSAEAAATQIGDLVTQAVGFATAVDESPFIQTAQALATEHGPDILASAQAIATQVHESGFLLTAQAKATEGVSFGQAPADIPLPDQEYLVNFFGSDHIISYNTPLDLQTVLEFYLEQMPANGWVEIPEERVLNENSAVLVYAKSGRLAHIALNVIPVEKSTIVLIMVQTD
jgi:hypothetical protein